MEEMGTQPADYDYVVFHQPNRKFPKRAMADWASRAINGRRGCWSAEIGNTYAGSALIGLSAVLDVAQPGSGS